MVGVVGVVVRLVVLVIVVTLIALVIVMGLVLIPSCARKIMPMMAIIARLAIVAAHLCYGPHGPRTAESDLHVIVSCSCDH